MLWLKENAILIVLLVSVLSLFGAIVVSVFAAKFVKSVRNSISMWDDLLIASSTKVVKTRKLLVIEGAETKKIPKSQMFDNRDTLHCTESNGMCEGPKCGHYRENVDGSDICRFNALEFTPD